jgi:hypothetical protein
MTKLLRFLSLVLVAASLATFAGCDKDPDNPHNSVPDPAGTITANISEDSEIRIEYGGDIYGDIGWHVPDNFYITGRYLHPVAGAQVYVTICDLGAMSGLGNIQFPESNPGCTPFSTSISSVACEQGHGYLVVFSHQSQSVVVRLYVVEPIVSTSGGIMGAKVKYQYPFEP